MIELIAGGVFLLVAATICGQIVRGVMEWNRNNHSPVEECRVRIVGKREEVNRHHHTNADGTMQMSTSTTYYVTFERENGVRQEFHVKGREYGMLAEGDRGTLSFQGTRYLGFVRG